MDVVGTNLFFTRGRDRMAALSHTADSLQGQIATGKKLTAASQDSAAWQRLQGLIQAKSDTTTYGANITLAQSVLSQTDTALASIQTQLQRAQELTIQANDGALSADNRKVIADQLDAIVADLTQHGLAKDARGLPLFDAAAAAIPVGDGVAVLVNEDPARVFGTILTALTSFTGQLRSGANVAADAATAIGALNGATADVAALQGSIGARAARVDLFAAALQDSATVTETQRAALEDTDLTSAISDLQKTMTILQATQASFSKLSQLSLFDYLK